MSRATAPTRELTPDDVLAMPDGKHCELVDGRIVESGMSSRSSHVAASLSRFLGTHCEPIGLAYVFVECGFTCFPGNPKQMRRPDVSCVRVDRLPFDQIGDGYLSLRPDLAAEVISPNDLVLDLEEKLEDYRQAGIPLVWLIYPPSRKVRVLRPEGPPTELGPDDELTGEDVLPGFRCRIADLFGGPPKFPS
ncbi:Uma2 family endonuclease [Tundrisphaera lichenicola]|uniref:Uma2 family endonuclease n=1 Tax=Tundrisphaera lichenicola TaxID=2029860 RepID=UPI003EBA6C84